MTHHQFGKLANSGIPHERGGDEAIVEIQDSILTQAVNTVAILGDDQPMLVLGFEGKVNHTEDTFQGSFILSWEFAGFVVGEIMKAAARSGPEDYRILSMGIDRSLDGDTANGE